MEVSEIHIFALGMASQCPNLRIYTLTHVVPRTWNKGLSIRRTFFLQGISPSPPRSPTSAASSRGGGSCQCSTAAERLLRKAAANKTDKALSSSSCTLLQCSTVPCLLSKPLLLSGLLFFNHILKLGTLNKQAEVVCAAAKRTSLYSQVC